MHLSLLEILATFMVLFAIIEILGSIPIILDVKAKTGSIYPGNTTLGSGAIVPIAFPLIAGAGSITTLLSLRAEYHFVNILLALSLNMIIVYLVLRLTTFFERILGPTPLSYSYQIRGLR